MISDVIWNYEKEEKYFAKRQIRTRVDRVTFTICAIRADDYSLSFVVLTITVRDI